MICLRKKIWLNTKKTRYCITKLFFKKVDMQDYYKKHCADRGLKDKGHYNVSGVSLHYENRVNGKCQPETGTVLLCLDHCGAGVVSHEFLHAVLWAYKHRKNKKQYPIIIKNMREEEDILQNHTFAVTQFYNWYWSKITAKHHITN